MRIAASLMVLSVVLIGCDQLKSISSNPFTSMRSEAADTGQAPETVKPLTPTRRMVTTVDQRALATRINSLEVTPVQGGVLVTASGMPSRAGAFNAELVMVTRENGRLNLEMRFQYPQANTSGAANSIAVSKLLSGSDIAGVRVIRVQGAKNSMERRN